MPYDYRTVKDQYDMLHDAGVVTEPLEKWSVRKNYETGNTGLYDAGVEDNFIKRASVGIDRLLEATGLPDWTEPIGRYAGKALEAIGLEGAEEEGAQMGRNLPRMAVNYAPMALAGTPLAPLGIAATAGLSGAEAYTATGSPAAGIIAGGTNIIMPGASNLVRQQVLKRTGANLVEGQLIGGVDKLLARAGLGGEAVKRAETLAAERLAAGAAVGKVKEYIPKNLAQGMLAGTAENVTGSLIGGVGGELESLFSDQPYEWSPTTELLNMTVGQLPFAATAAFKHGRAQFGGRAAREHEARLKTSVDLSEKAIEQHRLNEEVAGRTDITVVPETTQEVAAREARTTKLVDLREKQRAAKADGNTVAEEERQKLADEDNATLRDQWSVKPMPDHILGVPRELIPKRPVLDPTMPPEDPVVKLQTAEQRLAAAKDNVDFQDSIVEVNEVREQYGMRPLDDAEIALRQRQFSLGDDRAAVQSHIDETRRLATAREEGVALKAEVELRKADLTHADPMVRAEAMRRLAEIEAGSDKLDNARHIANMPMDRDTAPIKQYMHEQAMRITESSPEAVPGDQRKFLDWAQGGVLALKQKHGMDLEAAAEWLKTNPQIQSWKNRLELQVANGLEIPDYAQRHLMNQGMHETEAKQKAAVINDLANKPDLINNLLAVPTESAEVKKSGAEMANLLASDPAPTMDILKSQGVANADDLYNGFIRSGVIDEAVLVNLDGKVTDYVYAKAREHLQMVDVLRATNSNPFVSSPVDSPSAASRILTKLRNIETNQRTQAAEVANMSGMAPKTFLRNLMDGEYIPEFLDPVFAGGRLIANAYKTPAWLARINNHTAEFVAKGHQLSANINRMAMESFKAFGMDEYGNFDKKLVKSVRDKQITGALSKWMGINNRRGSLKDAEGNSPGVKVIRSDDPEVAKVLQGLPEDKQSTVKELMMRQVITTKNMQQQELGKMLEIYATEGTGFLGNRTGLKYNQNLRISNDALELAKIMNDPAKANDPVQMTKAQELTTQLQMALEPIQPGLFTDLQRMMGEKMLEYQEKEAFFKKNPAWAVDKRYGKWAFSYWKGNKLVTDSADSLSQMKEIADGNQIVAKERNDDYINAPIPYERDIPIEQADARWFDNHITWLNRNAAFWSRELYRKQKDAMLADPELAQRPDVLRLARQHSDNMLSPDPVIGQTMNRFASTWYLGWNAASAMVNATQLVVRGAAEMTKLTGNPITSYKRIMGGYKEMYDMWVPGAKGLSEEKQKIVKRLEREGVTTVTSEMFGVNEETGAELKRALSGHSLLKNPVSNLSRVYQTGGMSMFKMMERVNNIGAVFSAFDYYRTQKDAYGKQLSFEDAYQKALVFNRTVNDVGGKANRPIDLLSGTGEISKSLGLMATSLQTYNIGTIGQLVHYIKEGFLTPKDMQPSEKYHHKTALAHLLGAQVVAAGALGMPFVGTALAIIHQAWPGLEIEKKLRGGANSIFAQLFSDDEEDGGIIADMALTGVPSMFGWDMQSRLSMGNPMAGVSEINGFQPQLLFGTPTEMVTKFIKGGVEAAKPLVGLPAEPIASYVGDMVPPAAKKMIELARGQGKILDYNGKPIIEQPTPGEKVGMFLGFQPTSVSAQYKANRMRTRSEAAGREEVHRFNQQQASELAEKGNFGDVKGRLRARAEEALKTNPDYNWEDTARQIADAVVSNTYPNDLRRKLAPRDAAIAKWFPVPLNLPSEEARAQLKATTLRNLGVGYKPRDMAKYKLMDQIEAQNPGEYTSTEKRRLAEKLLGRERKIADLPL